MPRMVLDDSELKTTVFSPVCTFCRYWKPSDGHHCDAYPRGNTPRERTPAIPDAIWSGENGHMYAFPSAEHPTDHGIHFELHPAAKVSALPPALRTAFLARETERQEIEKPS